MVHGLSLRSKTNTNVKYKNKKKKKPFNPNRIEYEKFECEKK